MKSKKFNVKTWFILWYNYCIGPGFRILFDYWWYQSRQRPKK
jgi:hypothetical protein